MKNSTDFLKVSLIILIDLMAIVRIVRVPTRVGEGKMKIDVEGEGERRKGKIDKEVNAERFRN